MEIRDATEADFPALLPMAERFAEAAYGDMNIPLDASSCEETALMLMKTGFLLVTDDLKAMIGVIVVPWWFNRDVLMATEVFWWSENGLGGKLREAAEERAQALGATSIAMLSEEGMRSKALDRLFRSNGYQLREHNYLKELV